MKVQVDRIIDGRYGNSGMKFVKHAGANGAIVHTGISNDDWHLPTKPYTVTLEEYNRGERPW